MRSVVGGVFVGVVVGVLAFGVLASPAPSDQELVSIEIQNKTIPSPLTDQPGDAERGRRVVLDRERGDCAVCHVMPLPGRQFHGTIGLPLDGVGNRYTTGELRLRLVNPKRLNPQTVMPAYYKVKGLHQVLGPYRDKPILTAQEIEDVIAYLLTLHKETPHVAGAVKTKLTLPRNPLPEPNPYNVEDRRSGYTYLSEENQKLQDDDFSNPGMLWVERGQELWEQRQGTSQTSCAKCHADASESMRGTHTRYPRFDSRRQKLMNLEQQINRCREEHMQAAAYPYESEDLLALSAFVSFQSRGLPIQAQQVQIDGPAKPFFEAGQAFFMRRRGQLDMACAQCHEEHAGLRLRGDVISQGQTNGFPIYRHTWQTLGSTHRMFAWCNTAIRAEPLAYGADEYVNLELYLAWRGRGLPVETPAVRR
jgi:sulfur-oxidizing protein SoxA